MRIKPLVALVAACVAGWSAPAVASSTGLVISQIYGGGGANNSSSATLKSDYVELFNAGASAVSLAGLSIQYASADGTGTFATNSPYALPSVSLAPGQYFLVNLGSGSNGAALPQTADATSSSAINLSQSKGKVALVNSATGLACNGGSTVCSDAQKALIIDLVGYGAANYYEGAAAPAASATLGLYRAGNGCTDTNSNSADFSTAPPSPRNTGSTLNVCSAPINTAIITSCPTTLTVDSGIGGSATLSATDSDSVVNAITLTSVASGITLGTPSLATTDGGTASVALHVATGTAAGSYAALVQFANDDAQTASCSVNVTVTASTITPIYQIQGSGPISPLATQTVTTRGVVTKVLANGYFLQDPTGDNDATTSDGVLVYTSSTPTVTVGQYVQITAKVAEYNVGAASNADTAAHTVTELTGATNLTVLGSGSITPTVITLPEITEGDLERVEGMVVTINTPLTVSQNYFLGRYGQLTLSAGERLYIPTDRHRPGSAEALNLADENARRRILLDDGRTTQNPDPVPYLAADNTVRAGDTVDSITGVIDYGLATSDGANWGDYKIHPLDLSAVSFTRVNERTTVPASVGGNIKIASANVLNFFTTFGDGATASGQSGQGCAPSGDTSDCRGADNATEFTRQRAKIVANLAALNADVVGLMEIQNNGSVAAQNLVDGLNAQLGSGTYAVVADPASGVGTDAIKVALIYKPAVLTLAGPASSDTDASHKRLPVAQTFAAANGEKFNVVVNHFKSKGSCPSTSAADDLDQNQGDGQGCWNALRVQEAQALRRFVAGLSATTGTDRTVLLGDFNAYSQEDPIHDLSNNGFIDLAHRFDANTYSYVFDGAAGSLDHAMASSSLNSIVTGATKWHINADEPSVIDYNTEYKSANQISNLYSATPYRSSDHDPLLIGINLTKSINGSAGRDALTGTAGDDVINGGLGADTLTGGAGADVFVYTRVQDGTDTLTDFTPGVDRIDLSALLASLGYSAHNAINAGVVRLVASGSNTLVQIDADGASGAGSLRTLLTLRGITPAQISVSRDLGL